MTKKQKIVSLTPEQNAIVATPAECKGLGTPGHRYRMAAYYAEIERRRLVHATRCEGCDELLPPRTPDQEKEHAVYVAHLEDEGAPTVGFLGLCCACANGAAWAGVRPSNRSRYHRRCTARPRDNGAAAR